MRRDYQHDELTPTELVPEREIHELTRRIYIRRRLSWFVLGLAGGVLGGVLLARVVW